MPLPGHSWRRWLLAGTLACMACVGRAVPLPLEMVAVYAASVDKRLDMPPAEAQRYGELLLAQLQQAGLTGLLPQYFVLVDRSPQVQAVMVYWKDGDGFPQLIGASPASTGRPRGFEYFETPTGVFTHTLANPDFRAEGTKNARGIRGYGTKGMRVYDFGWQLARKGWGTRGTGVMRLQMHASDPDLLEPRLGSVQSKGCIRIPATLNRLIDIYGLLDADYARAQQAGRSLWVLAPDRQATSWPGRYLVIVDSQRDERPPWSPLPARPPRRVPPRH
jgi:hypothetical protein